MAAEEKHRRPRQVRTGNTLTPQAVSPPQSNRASLIAASLVALVAFFVYLRTLTPGMQMGDGTELAACAHVLGVPHPTGYPLYMLVLKAWLVITGSSDVILRTTLLNAVFMSAAAGLVVRITADVLSGTLPNWSSKARLFAAAAAGLSTAFLRFHWENAVVTEVYALQFLLMIAFVRVVQRSSHDAKARYVILAALLLGFGLAHQRMSVFLGIPFLLLLVRSSTQLPRATSTRTFGLAALLIISCLALYAYLPVRAAKAPLHWGNTRTLSGFIDHVRGSEYLARSFMRPAQGRSFTADTYITFASRETAQILGDFAGQFAAVPETYYSDRYVERVFLQPGWRAILLLLVLAPFLVFGAWRWRRATPHLFLSTTIIAAQNLLILYLYNIADIRDYYLFPMWFGWMCTWFGILAAAEYFARRRGLSFAAARYACLLPPFLMGLSNFPRCDHSADDSAERLSAAILPNLPSPGAAAPAVIPPNSILLTGGDHDTFTCWYRQYARGERQDVLIFASNFIWKPWYPLYFSPEQTARFQLRFAPNVAQDVVQYIDQLATGVIDANLPSTPIFSSIQDPAALQELARRYRLRPVNSAWLESDRTSPDGTTITLYRIEKSG